MSAGHRGRHPALCRYVRGEVMKQHNVITRHKLECHVSGAEQGEDEGGVRLASAPRYLHWLRCHARPRDIR